MKAVFVEEGMSVKEGDVLTLRVIRIDEEQRRIGLSLRKVDLGAYADMDMKALAAELMVKQGNKLENKVYGVPEEIDQEIARLKLDAMGVRIDVLTAAQLAYLNSWEEGT